MTIRSILKNLLKPIAKFLKYFYTSNYQILNTLIISEVCYTIIHELEGWKERGKGFGEGGRGDVERGVEGVRGR